MGVTFSLSKSTYQGKYGSFLKLRHYHTLASGTEVILESIPEETSK